MLEYNSFCINSIFFSIARTSFALSTLDLDRLLAKLVELAR